MGKPATSGKNGVSRRDFFKSTGAGLFVSGLAANRQGDAFSACDEPTQAGKTSGAMSSTLAKSSDFIDVREFMKTLTVEELAKTSEAYFAVLKNWDSHLAKPLAGIHDAPALLIAFAHALHGLQLLPGMTVVDFGAGSCWASHRLTQLGMEVIALDVSPTALKIGRTLYARQPLFGKRPAPRFLVFDGHRIALADASVDRILCLDTFHHILNPEEILREMSRILKAGGIAGFSEPGPHYSRTPQSQYEMRNFKVLENDIHIREVWFSARRAGFTRMELAVFSPQAHLLTLAEFEDYLNGGSASRRVAEFTRSQMEDRRLFFLHKGEEAPALDSRRRTGLAAQLQVNLASATVRQGTPLIAQVAVTNSGQATWLPHSSKVGGVRLTCHLLDVSGKMLAPDYFGHPLTPGDGRPIAPGETLQLRVRIPSPPKGRYILEFDLVSLSVGRFSFSGSETVRVTFQVV